MKKVTAVIDFHGAAKLLGVLTNKREIAKLKKLVKDIDQGNYIKFIEVELNAIDPEQIEIYR